MALCYLLRLPRLNGLRVITSTERRIRRRIQLSVPQREEIRPVLPLATEELSLCRRQELAYDVAIHGRQERASSVVGYGQ